MFGFGKDKDDKQIEPAQGSNGTFDRAANSLAQHLISTGIDGVATFDSAAKVADEALKKNGSREAAVDAIVRSHTKLAGANGFVTNLGGFATMVVALPANVLGFYVLATRMAASVARVRGYDLSQPEIRSAVLLSLVGADAQDLLAKAGVVAPTGRLAGMAAQRLPGPALMVVNKAVGFRILSSAGKGVFARFGKAVPVVGGAVGAGMDVWLMRQIGAHVRTEFPAASVDVG